MTDHTTSPPYAVVVDDNPAILLHMVDVLTEAGFSVLAAADVESASKHLQAYGDVVVLLFTNVELSGSDTGFALAREAADRWPQMAILVSSGRFSPEPGDMPADAVFIAKPYSDDAVLAQARQLFEHKNPALMAAGQLAL